MTLSKMLKAIYFIIGTAIGTGILALPVATAKAWFWYSLLALIVAWFL